MVGLVAQFLAPLGGWGGGCVSRDGRIGLPAQFPAPLKDCAGPRAPKGGAGPRGPKRLRSSPRP